MILNFLRIAIRQLTKHKVYSLINVLGLSLGLCCFILLTLFVKRELSFDNFQTNKQSVHELFVADSAKVEGPYASSTMAPMGPEVMKVVPEVVNYTRFGRSDFNVITDEKTFQVSEVCYTDPNTFEMFDIELLAGVFPKDKFLKDQVLISEEEALRYYENVEGAIGKIIEVPDLAKLQVVGVFKDMPENSHMGFKMLLSFEHANDLLFYGTGFSIPGMDVNKWGKISTYATYIQTTDGVNLTELKSKIQSAWIPHIGQLEVELVSLADLYLHEYNPGYFRDKGNMKELKLYVAVGLILLLIAVVNYMNLSTARFSKRAKEVGIRKTIGGHRNQLIYQFLVESMTITFFALILGLVMAEMVMPYFNGYTGKVVDIDYSSPGTYFFLAGTIVMIGLISGIYPAFYLSRFSAQQNLASGNGGKDKSVFRKVLVGVQFAICLGLISSTFILFSQHEHMRTLDMGFDADQLMVVELGEELQESAKSIAAEVMKSPDVAEVRRANISPFNGSVTTSITVEDEEINAGMMIVESGMMKMLGVEVVKGNLFADLPASDASKAILVNEALVRSAGWEEPLGKILMGDRKVVGVIKDFVYESAKNEIKPTMIMESDKSGSYLYARMTGDVKKGLEDIENSIRQFDSEYMLDYTFLDDVFAAKYEAERRLGQIFGLFSILTIFIAGLGVFGLSIFIAESRIKEIGIRKVLGAKLGQVVWLLNSGVTLLVLLVALATLPAVYYFTDGWLNDFAFRIDLNVLHFILPLAVLLSIIWSILFYQSYKSANANPVNALRAQ